MNFKNIYFITPASLRAPKGHYLWVFVCFFNFDSFLQNGNSKLVMNLDLGMRIKNPAPTFLSQVTVVGLVKSPL